MIVMARRCQHVTCHSHLQSDHCKCSSLQLQVLQRTQHALRQPLSRHINIPDQFQLSRISVSKWQNNLEVKETMPDTGNWGICDALTASLVQIHSLYEGPNNCLRLSASQLKSVNEPSENVQRQATTLHEPKRLGPAALRKLQHAVDINRGHHHTVNSRSHDTDTM